MPTTNCWNSPIPVTVPLGGTGGTTIASHGLTLIGNTTSAITTLAAASNNTVCMGVTSSDPVMTTSGTPYVTGISFDSGSNTLNSYSSGTWTPTISFNITTGTLVYATQSGNYVKIGKLVWFAAYVAMTSIGVSSGVVTINNMPFTALNADPNTRKCVLAGQGITFPVGATYIRGNITKNTTNCSPAAVGSAFTAIGINFTNLSNTFSMYVSGCYIASS